MRAHQRTQSPSLPRSLAHYLSLRSDDSRFFFFSSCSSELIPSPWQSGLRVCLCASSETAVRLSEVEMLRVWTGSSSYRGDVCTRALRVLSHSDWNCSMLISLSEGAETGLSWKSERQRERERERDRERVGENRLRCVHKFQNHNPESECLIHYKIGN